MLLKALNFYIDTLRKDERFLFRDIANFANSATDYSSLTAYKSVLIHLIVQRAIVERTLTIL